MADRYFVESPITGPRAALTGQEAHHLAHVMRAKPGDEVTLFDGGGREYAARVAEVSRRETLLDVLEAREISRESPVWLCLAVALPKGDRQRWLVEKVVELGAARLVPLTTHRGVAEAGDRALERLRRTVVEASKQCGRNRLMEIAQPIAWNEHARSIAADEPRLIAHTSGEETLASWLEHARSTYRWHAAIGPEGGFTNDELDLARAAGWSAVSLGVSVLRVETAATCLAAAALAVGR